MKKIFSQSILSAVALLWLLTACTQSDGHIGPLFGAWTLVEMTDSGEAVSFPAEDYSTIAFQNNLARFMYHKADGEVLTRYCTWTQSDNIITFDFNHTEGGTGNNLTPPQWLHFPAKECSFTLAGPSKGCFTLTGTGVASGLTFKYEKTW